MQAGLPLLSSWQNFAMILGTAAATLTGLMFVSITLISGYERHEAVLNAGISAFNSPTIVHFCAVLLTAILLSFPWPAFSTLGVVLGLLDIGVMVYLGLVMDQMRHMPGYHTPLHDWLWYLVFPGIAYIILFVAAVLLLSNPVVALYIISAVMIILLFIGIRNAWDLVTFLAVQRSHPQNNNQE